MSVSANSRPLTPSLLHEIWVRRWSVAAIAALATASAIYYSLRLPPSYAAESRVLVSSIEVAGASSDTPSPPNMATEQEIARSSEVVRAVREASRSRDSGERTRRGSLDREPGWDRDPRPDLHASRSGRREGGCTGVRRGVHQASP